MLSPDQVSHDGGPPYAREALSQEEECVPSRRSSRPARSHSRRMALPCLTPAAHPPQSHRYAFQTAGYLCVPAALGAAETQWLSAAVTASLAAGASPLLQPAVRELLVQPTAVWYLNELVGAGYRLDTEPELLPPVAEPLALTDGALPRRPKDAFYHTRLGKRQCNSVRVVIALDSVRDGDGGFSLVPCSHTVNVEAPPAVRAGDPLRQLGEGVWQQPPMEAGDMLVVAGACLQGLQPWRGARPQRLLSLSFVGRSIVSTDGPNVLPHPNAGQPWWEALSDAQQ